MQDQPQDVQYSQFNLNYNAVSGKWRGSLAVPVRDGTAITGWHRREFEGAGPFTSERSGRESIVINIIAPGGILDQARENRLDPDLAHNKPANYTAGVNRGTLWIPTPDQMTEAKARGKGLPVQGHVLIVADGVPTYVDLAGWARTRKNSKAPQDGDGAENGEPQEARIDFFSGTAEFHDPAKAEAARAAKRSASAQWPHGPEGEDGEGEVLSPEAELAAFPAGAPEFEGEPADETGGGASAEFGSHKRGDGKRRRSPRPEIAPQGMY